MIAEVSASPARGFGHVGDGQSQRGFPSLDRAERGEQATAHLSSMRTMWSAMSEARPVGWTERGARWLNRAASTSSIRVATRTPVKSVIDISRSSVFSPDGKLTETRRIAIAAGSGSRNDRSTRTPRSTGTSTTGEDRSLSNFPRVSRTTISRLGLSPTGGSAHPVDNDAGEELETDQLRHVAPEGIDEEG